MEIRVREIIKFGLRGITPVEICHHVLKKEISFRAFGFWASDKRYIKPPHLISIRMMILILENTYSVIGIVPGIRRKKVGGGPDSNFEKAQSYSNRSTW